MIEQAGVLLGELQKDSEEKCVFVKGVIKSVVEDKGERIHFDENVWNRIYSDTEKYFPNLSVVGWFAVVPDLTSERMAVMMVVGNQARVPDSIFKGVRTLTTNIVLEMGYATDLHREALIATGVVLFVFILIINISFSILKRRGKE